MKIEFVDMEGFWKASCLSGFWRLNRFEGVRGDTHYITTTPPDNRFIERRMAQASKAIE